MKTTLEIGKEEMFKAIRELYQEYSLPRLNIKTNEWHTFFNVTCAHFDNEELVDDYPVALNIIIRRALNLALIDGADEVTIKYLIDALCDLSVFHIYTDEINEIQETIKAQINDENERKLKYQKNYN